MPSVDNFGIRLSHVFAEEGQLCVGVDPHSSLLKVWNLNDDVAGLESFASRVLEAVVAAEVGIIKPQVAFFERFGSDGFRVLAKLTEAARESNVLVIADAKRGDIGTTMDAYLDAWFGETSGLYADALTVSPYLGLKSITTGFEKWIDQGKGIFSLVATSNPEGASVQLAKVGAESLAANQYSSLIEANGRIDFGPFGAVLGATLDFEDFGIALTPSNVPILAPGFGAQGALLSEANKVFGHLAKQVCFSVSRSVLADGPDCIEQRIQEAKSELTIGLAS